MNLTAKKRTAWRGLRACRAADPLRKGVAAVEFALTLTFFWIPLLLGLADGSIFLLVNEKLDRISYSVTDIVTQYSVISLANLADISLAASQMMQPYSFSGGNGILIISSVYQPSGTGVKPIVCWQYSASGLVASGASAGSKIGSPGNSSTCATGGTAVLPSGLTLNAGDNVIISEVYYTFSPLFLDQFLSKTLYRYAVYKPRLSPLTVAPS